MSVTTYLSTSCQIQSICHLAIMNNIEQWRGHSVVCQMSLGGPSAFGYYEQHGTVKWSLCCLSNVTGGYIISFTWVKLTFPYIFLLVDFSWYFPISWLFWMGSHWSHWTAKSSLCALAVLMGGYIISFTWVKLTFPYICLWYLYIYMAYHYM